MPRFITDLTSRPERSPATGLVLEGLTGGEREAMWNWRLVAMSWTRCSLTVVRHRLTSPVRWLDVAQTADRPAVLRPPRTG
jgi:hypothetical protein